MMDRFESEPYANPARCLRRNEDGSPCVDADPDTGCTAAEMAWPEMPVLAPITAKTVEFTSPEFRHLNLDEVA